MATFGKVKYIYLVPADVTLASLTDYELPATLKNLGRITGDDGLEISQLRGDGDNVYDDNGDVALTSQGDVEQTITMTFLDIDINAELNKLLYGESNVSVASDGTFSVNVTGEYTEPSNRFVFETTDGNNNKKRMFLNGRLKQSESESFAYNEAVTIGATIAGEPIAVDDFTTRDDGTIVGLRAGDYRASAIIRPIPEA